MKVPFWPLQILELLKTNSKIKKVTISSQATTFAKFCRQNERYIITADYDIALVGHFFQRGCDIQDSVDIYQMGPETLVTIIV